METDQTSQSLSWIKRIPGDLISLDEKPLFGSPPPFPLDGFASQIAAVFQLKNVKFQPENWKWLPADQLYNGFGDNLKITPLHLTPVEGQLWWVMSQADFNRMLTNMVAIDGLNALDPEIHDALSTFFTIQVMEAFTKCDFDKKLSLQILNEPTKPASACLSIDITITAGDTTFPSRLLLSPEFRHNWKERYIQDAKKLMLESPLADSLEVVVHLEAGRLNISIEEWDQLQQGDFVVLENCSLDPNEDKGRVMLVINGTPFFRAKLKQGNLKILEYPLYYEVPSMNAPKEEEAKKGKDEDFDEDFEDFDSEEKGKEEPKAPSAAKETIPTEKKKDKSEDFDEDFDIEDDLSVDDFDEKELDEKGEEKKPAAKAPKETAPEVLATPTKATSLEDIPLTVVLEVGRIQMSIKKLLELQPGNMLELDIHPEAGVDMVVNGKKVARGELLKIGDAIGVRISERL